MRQDSLGIGDIVTATLALALASTLADVVWGLWIPEHRMMIGLIHGGILLGGMGVVLGGLPRPARPLEGGIGGLLIGLGSAGVFYLLAPALGMSAMFPAWMALWMAFAFLDRWLRPGFRPAGVAVARGVMAALASGVAFWAISGIWMGAHDPGLLYWRNFVAWCVAFAPGFTALLLRAGPKRSLVA